MQKRSEINNEVKKQFKTKFKKTAVLALCLLFAYSAIYAADIANKRMLKNENEDRYAVRVSMAKDDKLRLDLAGTQHYFDIDRIKTIAVRLMDKTKEMVIQFIKESEDFIEGMENYLFSGNLNNQSSICTSQCCFFCRSHLRRTQCPEL